MNNLLELPRHLVTPQPIPPFPSPRTWGRTLAASAAVQSEGVENAPSARNLFSGLDPSHPTSPGLPPRSPHTLLGSSRGVVLRSAGLRPSVLPMARGGSTAAPWSAAPKRRTLGGEQSPRSLLVF